MILIVISMWVDVGKYGWADAQSFGNILYMCCEYKWHLKRKQFCIIIFCLITKSVIKPSIGE